VRVAILDDWFDTLRTLPCFEKLAGHDVTVFTDHIGDTETLARRLAAAEALVLIRERTEIRAPHIDIDTCTALGIVVSSDQHAGTPS
jgi:D-3-phosphoglycerate dehydrogenase